MPERIGAEHGVTSENPRLEHAGKGPGQSAVVAPGPTRLAKARVHVVELPPTDHDVVGIDWVESDRRLIRCVADDIHPGCVDVHLDAAIEWPARQGLVRLR